MNGNVNDTDKFWLVQGDRVLVCREGYADRVFKIVRVVDERVAECKDAIVLNTRISERMDERCSTK